jgi:hypothetical protein
MNMAILNYTTQIDVEKTIGEIQRCLSLHGASSIKTDYEDGIVKAISFLISFGGQPIGYKLPTDWQPVLEVMKKDTKVPRRLLTKEQAVRVAWRIVKDWIEAQMAIVETRMVEIGDVFLPYMVMKGGKTLAEQVRSDPKFLLGDGK